MFCFNRLLERTLAYDVHIVILLWREKCDKNYSQKELLYIPKNNHSCISVCDWSLFNIFICLPWACVCVCVWTVLFRCIFNMCYFSKLHRVFTSIPFIQLFVERTQAPGFTSWQTLHVIELFWIIHITMIILFKFEVFSQTLCFSPTFTNSCECLVKLG